MNSSAESVNMKHRTLSDVSDWMAQAVNHAMGNTFIVTAELHQLRTVKGNTYLELANYDNGKLVAKSTGIILRANADHVFDDYEQAKGRKLAIGDNLKLAVEGQYSPLYGFSLRVYGMLPIEGGQASQLDQDLMQQLRSTGKSDYNHQLTLGQLSSIAVLCPANSAAKADFERAVQALVTSGMLSIDWYPCAFQESRSSNTLAGVLSAIRNNAAQKQYDAVFIIRGGGATGDIRALNNFDLLNAVAQHPFPVVTGIGHESDTPLIQRVATRACSTPTAAANLIVEQFQQRSHQQTTSHMQKRLTHVSVFAAVIVVIMVVMLVF